MTSAPPPPASTAPAAAPTAAAPAATGPPDTAAPAPASTAATATSATAAADTAAATDADTVALDATVDIDERWRAEMLAAIESDDAGVANPALLELTYDDPDGEWVEPVLLDHLDPK